MGNVIVFRSLCDCSQVVILRKENLNEMFLVASGSASDSYVNNLQLWVYQLYVCVSVQGNLAHFVPALYLANCCFITGWLLSLAIKPYNSVSPI